VRPTARGRRTRAGRERHGVEGAAHFYVPIGMDRPLAREEERKDVDGQGLQGALLDLDEVRPDLAPRGAMNAEPGDRSVPAGYRTSTARPQRREQAW
jgi:hypothetical protein